jgi:BirA family transcriptional regulator, biotin operon repressor / biotin---[acetyl-CoA-carboxylase] ligase
VSTSDNLGAMTTPGATWQITTVDETGSTNVDLLAAAATGAADRSVLMARHQTDGRGRLDRRWAAPPGANLLVSMLFRDVPKHPHELTQRVALAAAEAGREVAGVSPTLKWPNDLLLDGRKLAGVLAQSGGRSDGGEPAYVVVGIGLNVGWAPEGGARLGDGIDPAVVLDHMLDAYDRLPADIAGLYRASLATIGQPVRVELPGSAVFGRALDVMPDGRLVVLDECGITHRFDTGDVVHLR